MAARNHFLKRFAAFLLLLLGFHIHLNSQILTKEMLGGKSPINTAVPFITISPDARANSMGGCGVASAPDINSQHWNVSKYAFIQEKGGLSLNYIPWLRAIIPDINLAYLSAYFKPSNRQAISTSLRYFSLGEISMPSTGSFQPFEMTFDLGYSRQLSQTFYAGAIIRYIHSDIVGSGQIAGQDSNIGKSLAVDLGVYYSKDLQSMPFPSILAFGATLSNIGTPVSYTQDAAKIPIPANLRIGTSFELSLRENHALTLNIDLNKLLVSSSAMYSEDTLMRGIPKADNYFLALIQSFYDAPGIPFADGSYSTVIREELSEIILNLGLEYTFAGKYFGRAGYFHEAEYKGGRQYFTIGAGVIFNTLSLDLAYFIISNDERSPLRNTLSISLSKKFR